MEEDDASQIIFHLHEGFCPKHGVSLGIVEMAGTKEFFWNYDYPGVPKSQRRLWTNLRCDEHIGSITYRCPEGGEQYYIEVNRYGDWLI